MFLESGIPCRTTGGKDPAMWSLHTVVRFRVLGFRVTMSVMRTVTETLCHTGVLKDTYSMLLSKSDWCTACKDGYEPFYAYALAAVPEESIDPKT